jgi:hypothetical protein
MKLVQAILIFSLMGTAACTPTIRSEIFPEDRYDIAGMNTYAWGKKPLSVIGVIIGGPTEQLESVLKNELSAALADKGYTRADRAADPDIVIIFTAGAFDRMAQSVHRMDGNFNNASVIWSQTNDYLEGGVSITFQHPETEKTMWRGMAVDRVKSQKQDGSTVKRLIEEIMKSFPDSR